MRKFLTLVKVLVCISFLAQAQTRKVSGKVLDEKGDPVPFASVKIKGTNNGVAADQNGGFQIALDANTSLLISSAGYANPEVSIGSSIEVVTITMKANAQMQEVVVTAQGIRRRPRELGVSVAKLSNDDIMVGRSPQLAQSLSGKVAGLAVFNVNNSVDPSFKFTLRGYRSITGSNDALVVI